MTQTLYHLTNFKVWLHLFLPVTTLKSYPMLRSVLSCFLDQRYPYPTEKFGTIQWVIKSNFRIFLSLFEQPFFKFWSYPITKIQSDYLWTGPVGLWQRRWYMSRSLICKRQKTKHFKVYVKKKLELKNAKCSTGEFITNTWWYRERLSGSVGNQLSFALLTKGR